MIRALVFMIAIALPMGAQAQSCDTISPGVLFCGADSAFAGAVGEYDPAFGATFYSIDDVTMLTGGLPSFAETALSATGDLTAVVDSFAAQENVAVLDRVQLLGDLIPAATMLYQIQPELISLVTAIDLSGVPVFVQTVQGGTTLTERHRDLHLAALQGLTEDGL